MATPQDDELRHSINELNKTMKSAAHGVGTGFGGMIRGLGMSAVVASTGLGKLADMVKGTEDAYRKLSESGASFSNDLAQMNLAAVQSRMDLDEFADLISKNGRNLAGLGGSVTRGSENFAKISNEFHQGDLQLRQMGYSVGEMNQLLIDQIASNRTLDVQDAQERKRITDSTMLFAKELDLTSKLTGKNRAELAEQMRNRQSQARMEAAVALATRGMSKEQADAVRDNIKQMQAQAESTGMGQAFREMIETGTLYSETARTQAALGGDAFNELAASSKLALQGQTKEAQARMDSAKALAVQNQNDPSTQIVTAMSGALESSIGTVAADMAADLKPMVDGLNDLAKSTGNLLQTQEDYQRGLQEIVDRLTNAQEGMRYNDLTKQYDKVDQLTTVVTKIDQAWQTAAADIATGIEKDFLPSIRSTAGKIADSIDTSAIHDKVTGALNLIGSTLNGEGSMFDKLSSLFTTMTGEAAKAWDTAIPKMTTAISDAVKGALLPYAQSNTSVKTPETVDVNKLPKRHSGSLGMTGEVLEDWGQDGTPVLLGGKEPEGVLTKTQLTDLANNAYSVGASASTQSAVANVQQIVTNLETGVTELAQPSDSPISKNAQYTAIDPAIKEQFKLQEEASKKADADRRVQNQKAEQDRQKSGAYIDKHKKTSKDVAGAMKTVDADKSKETVVAPNNPSDENKPDINSIMLNADGSMSFAAKKQQEQKPQEQMGPPKPEEAKKDEEAKKTATQANQATIKQTDVMNDILDQLKQLNARMASFMDQSEKLSKKQTNVIRQQNAL